MKLPTRGIVAAGLAICCAYGLAADPWSTESPAYAEAPGPTLYWTWDQLEPDTVASAWLLRRYSKRPVEIRLIPRGEHSSDGTPFDVPLAALSRTRTASTFHVLREHLAIDDPSVLALERVIDEIEITGWDRLPSEEASRLDRELRRLIDDAPRPEDALQSAATYLDATHASHAPQKQAP